MKNGSGAGVTLRLVPRAEARLTLDEVARLMMVKFPFTLEAARDDALELALETRSCRLECQIATEPDAPGTMSQVTLFASIYQGDLDAAATELNSVKCELSRAGCIIHGDEPAYICGTPECSAHDEGLPVCGYCFRLRERLREIAEREAAETLGWISSYPERREHFIASLKACKG